MATKVEPPKKRYTEADWTDFAHTGPDTLAGRYMRLFWHPICLATDLPPGRAKPVTLMGEQLTLYRSEGGTPHLLAFRCAHRGTQLSTGWVEGDNIRCFYHGWTYGPDGQCVQQPAEPEPFCEKIKVRSHAAAEYLGLIFAYIGEGTAPPLPRYLDFEQEGVLEAQVYLRACNYFQDFENDPVHGSFVHSRGMRRPVPLIEAEESEWGLTVRTIRLEAAPKVKQWGMPNVYHTISPPFDVGSGFRDTLHWRVPIDDEHEMGVSVDLVHVTGEAARQFREQRAEWYAKGGRWYAPELSAAVLAGEVQLRDLYDRTDLEFANVEDDVSQIGQGPIADRSNERLGREDMSVILLRKLWARELRALAEGQPLKQWIRTERLLATPDLTRTVDNEVGAFGGAHVRD